MNVLIILAALSLSVLTIVTPLRVYAGSNVPPVSGALPVPKLQFEQVWSYFTFGSGIGGSGMVAIDIDNDGSTELLTTGTLGRRNSSDFWGVVRFDQKSKEYRIINSTDGYNDASGRIKVIAAQSIGNRPTIFVGLSNGRIEIFDGPTQKKLGEIQLPMGSSEVQGITIGDADNDGRPEVVVLTRQDVLLYDAYSYVLKHGFSHNPTGDSQSIASAITLGNVDRDSKNEIILASGLIYEVDGASTAVEWDNRAAGIGVRLEVADIDGDGMDEVIVSNKRNELIVYDADLRVVKWRVGAGFAMGAIHVADVDNDGNPEILYGDGQWGSIYFLSSSDGATKWTIPNPDYGVTNIIVTDGDRDGDLEIFWSASESGSGPHRLYVYDVKTFVQEFASVDVRGPFHAMALGDVDGDNRDEIVFASIASDHFRGDSILFIHDADTFDAKWRSDPLYLGGRTRTGIHDIVIGDVDADGDKEMVIATDSWFDGAIFVINGQSRVIEWSSNYNRGCPLAAVEIADTNGDQVPEIVAGDTVYYPQCVGTSLYVINGKTSAMDEEIKLTSSGLASIYDLQHHDLRPNGMAGIVASLAPNPFNPSPLFMMDDQTKKLNQFPFENPTGFAVLDITGDGNPEIIAGTADGQLIALDILNSNKMEIAKVCESGVTSIKPFPSDVRESAFVYSCVEEIGIYDMGARSIAWRSQKLSVLPDPNSIFEYAVGFGNNLVVRSKNRLPTIFVGHLNGVRAFRPVSIDVNIDVVPKSSKNVVQLEFKENRCNGEFKVAVLSTDIFNSADLDPKSVRVGDPNIQLSISAKEYELEDVNKDGKRDVVLEFSACEMLNRGAIRLETRRLMLTGYSNDGAYGNGLDTVTFVLKNEQPEDKKNKRKDRRSD